MCEFGWGDVSHYAIWTDTNRSAPYQVLLDDGYRWTNPNPDGRSVQLPPNVIDGGAAGTVADDEHTFVCEALAADDNWHPGKFWKQSCNYAYGGSPDDDAGREIVAYPGIYDHVRVLVK